MAGGTQQLSEHAETLAATDQKSNAMKINFSHCDLNGDAFALPSYSMKQVRDAIPKHCLHPDTLTSFSYVLRDLGLIAITGYASSFIHHVPHSLLRGVFWVVYTFLQGLFGTGLWILAHECGHGAFSGNQRLQDFTGWVLHSALMVPYFSWKITHRKHHSNTGNVEKDNAFVPKSRQRWAKRRFSWLFGEIDVHAKAFAHMTEDAPIRILLNLALQQILGWPIYLLTNATGQVDDKHNVPYHRKSHFYFGSDSVLFNADCRRLVLLSDIGIGITWSGLYLAGQRWGWWNVTLTYLLPLLWVNHWIGKSKSMGTSRQFTDRSAVAITYLHHTDPTLPHYKDKIWSFSRGAAATIDRDFGFIGRYVFHHIIETHVLHHAISTIPHYHAEEASQAMRKVMGVDYKSDTKTNLLVALWKVQRDCKFVEESDGKEGSGVLFFRNLHSKTFETTLKPMPLLM
jgi:omega-6 fatty acid desaturase / acyl-lipid omega-6 desaturase (Delta-12 desaturase)